MSALLDEREQILLERFIFSKGDIPSVAHKMGISVMQTSRLLKRIHYKAVKVTKHD